MDTKARVRASIWSGVFCAVVGSLLGAIVVVALRAIHSPEDSNRFASFIPIALVFAAIQAVPFGLVIGSVGGWWLAPRAASGASSRYIFLQSSVMGAILGSTFPILAMALGWGSPENLVSVLPISIGIGVICALSLTLVMRKFVPATPQ